MSESIFHITVSGEGQNVAGFARQLSYSKSYTRTELVQFAVADQRFILGEQAEATFEAMDDEQLADWASALTELEADVLDGEDFLSHAHWDIRIN